MTSARIFPNRACLSFVGALVLSLAACSPVAVPAPAGGAELALLPSAAATAINDAGQVVGWVGDPRVAQHAFLWKEGTVIDLGTLGGTRSVALAVSNRGHVVGQSLTDSGTSHAFLWSDGTMTDLGTLGGDNSVALALNERGQIVGASETASGKWHAFLWQDGAMSDLGGSSEFDSEAVDINESGEIIGNEYLADSRASIVRWAGDGTHQSMNLGGGQIGSACAAAMTDEGAIVGTINRINGFLWKDGALTDLGSLGGDITWPRAVNARGQVVGTSWTSAELESAFLWEKGNMADLGSIGLIDSHAFGINGQDQIVGQSGLPGVHQEAFLWQGGTMTELHISTPLIVKALADGAQTLSSDERGTSAGVALRCGIPTGDYRYM